MTLADKTLYKAPYLYLVNMWLKEYDLEKANISILFEEGVLSESDYQKFYNMPKEDREVQIGCMMKDNKDLTKVLQNGLKKARNTFLIENHIEDNNVLYIDNDSITIIEPRTSSVENKYVTNFSKCIHFKMKNVYSSMYRLKDVDFLYFNNRIEERYRIKYANKNMRFKHTNGFLEFLLTICNEAEMGHVLNTLQMIKYTYCMYIRCELPTDFYREFNQRSQFKFKQTGSFSYYTDIPPTGGMQYIDISFNAFLFMELYKYFSIEYFKRGSRV